MVNQHTPEPFAPVILGLAVLVVSPALASLAPAPIMATLTATPLRQAGTVVLGGVLLTMFAFLVASRERVRGSSTVEGDED